MSESKHATPTPSERPASPDEIGWDPDDAPELDEAWFERADVYDGQRLVERGHRPGKTVRLVLPVELAERFRAGGRGWSIRIEEALRQWLVEHPERAGETETR